MLSGVCNFFSCSGRQQSVVAASFPRAKIRPAALQVVSQYLACGFLLLSRAPNLRQESCLTISHPCFSPPPVPQKLDALDKLYKLTGRRNLETGLWWYQLCLGSNYDKVFPEVCVSRLSGDHALWFSLPRRIEPRNLMCKGVTLIRWRPPLWIHWQGKWPRILR